jgi:hypothetical protein
LLHNKVSGFAKAGGITKALLDAKGGDPTDILIQRREASSLITDFDNIVIDGGGVETGMVAFVEQNCKQGRLIHNGHYKVTSKSSGTAASIDDTLVESDVSSISGGYNIYINGTYRWEAGDKCFLDGTDSSRDGIELTIVSGGTGYITVDEYLIGLTDPVGVKLYPTTNVYIGGAYADLQDALDEGDAEFKDCWIFRNSDFAETDNSYSINGSDGDYLNNTKKYIVGYKQNCYDSLPAGYGYFPEALGDGAGYKTPLARRQGAHLDADIKADLVHAALDTTGVNAVFEIEDAAGGENVVMMGFYTSGDNDNYSALVRNLASSTHYPSLEVRHCVVRNNLYETLDASGFGARACLVESSNSIEVVRIHDCLSLAGTLSHYGATDNGRLEIDHCIMDRNGLTIGGNTSYMSFHHNIMYECKWGVQLAQESYVEAYNNTFYKTVLSPIWLDVNDTVKGILDTYNNIYVLDSEHELVVPGGASESVHGFYREGGGGTVNENYNCIINANGTTVKWRADSQVNADWVEPVIGDNSVEVDPMFADAAGFDFRPINPKVITGGKPVGGVATCMGAVGPKLNSKTNARVANFGRLNTVRS